MAYTERDAAKDMEAGLDQIQTPEKPKNDGIPELNDLIAQMKAEEAAESPIPGLSAEEFAAEKAKQQSADEAKRGLVAGGEISDSELDQAFADAKVGEDSPEK